MNSEDYIADLEEETRTLRRRVAELEEDLRQVRGELEIALHRKVEETDEGLPAEEPDHQNRPKKEEKIGLDLGITATKREVKQEVKPKKSEPAHDMVIAPARGSTAPPQREPSLAHPQSDDDDVIMVDSVQQTRGKRKNDGDQPNPRPAKRQSFWVEVPPRHKTLSVSVKVEPSNPEVTIEAEGTTPTPKQEPDQELTDALAVIRNTNLKKDKKALNDVSVYTRLSKIGLDIFPIPIEDKIKEFSIGRLFLSKHFGGSSVDAFPRIKQKRLKEHGFDKFMYLPLTLHPHAPSLPGAPGLWMNCNDNQWYDEGMRVVVRVVTKPLALWQYMGQYDVQPSDPLSLEEWIMQSEQTKKEWVDHMFKGKWGGDVQARIKFRKYKGREPTEEDEDEMDDLGPGEITAEDIRQAFDKGEEHLHTWSMKCRGYDERFQREIWNVASTRAKKEE